MLRTVQDGRGLPSPDGLIHFISSFAYGRRQYGVSKVIWGFWASINRCVYLGVCRRHSEKRQSEGLLAAHSSTTWLCAFAWPAFLDNHRKD